MSDLDLTPIVEAFDLEAQRRKRTQQRELNTFKAYVTAKKLDHLIPLIQKSQSVMLDLLLPSRGNEWRIQQLEAQY
ncbi:hypothetical protein [Synechococcus sp. PCC 6312]|uniref:hypothetical protein n=1 Tax=Synechococcus sp. (strain ATCC 27167 / PCC 6312) TaxID=195253 RepID=UPI00029ECE02|nr:hypothetical protein [Synechococcus sp. PCC 6312]AFY60074.1 hypothetical protein Syn6312_0864 [Synechococcus sp. PCC 6312]